MNFNFFKLDRNGVKILLFAGILLSLYWLPAVLDEWNIGMKYPLISKILRFQLQLGNVVFLIALIVLFLFFIYTTVSLSIFIAHAVKNKNYEPVLLLAILFLAIIILISLFFIEKVTGLQVCPYLKHPRYVPM